MRITKSWVRDIRSQVTEYAKTIGLMTAEQVVEETDRTFPHRVRSSDETPQHLAAFLIVCKLDVLTSPEVD